MAELGFHTRAIADATGFTTGQVNSRASLYGIRRRDYRDGVNDAAGRVMAVALKGEPVRSGGLFTKEQDRQYLARYTDVRAKIQEKMRDARVRKGKQGGRNVD